MKIILVSPSNHEGEIEKPGDSLDEAKLYFSIAGYKESDISLPGTFKESEGSEKKLIVFLKYEDDIEPDWNPSSNLPQPTE